MSKAAKSVKRIEKHSLPNSAINTMREERLDISLIKGTKIANSGKILVGLVEKQIYPKLLFASRSKSIDAGRKLRAKHINDKTGNSKDKDKPLAIHKHTKHNGNAEMTLIKNKKPQTAATSLERKSRRQSPNYQKQIIKESKVAISFCQNSKPPLCKAGNKKADFENNKKSGVNKTVCLAEENDENNLQALQQRGKNLMSGKIQELIRNSIKKHKEKVEKQHIQKEKQGEKQKKAREILSERNKFIREMNAKLFKSPKGSLGETINLDKKLQQIDKEKKGENTLTSNLFQANRMERRASLGLDFIDLKAKMFPQSVAKNSIITPKTELISESRPEEIKEPILQSGKQSGHKPVTKEKQGAILNYMAHKNQSMIKERKQIDQCKIERKGKINKNKMQLQENVNEIFSSTNKRKSPTSKTSKSFCKNYYCDRNR